jgi:hypothetical protein
MCKHVHAGTTLDKTGHRAINVRGFSTSNRLANGRSMEANLMG